MKDSEISDAASSPSANKQFDLHRGFLVLVGLGHVVIGLVEAVTAEQVVAEDLLKPGKILPEQVDATLAICYGLAAMFFVAGIILTGLGALMKRLPRTCTITAAGLFVLVHVISAVLDPMPLSWVTVVGKIVFLGWLIQSIRAAMVYQNELTRASPQRGGGV